MTTVISQQLVILKVGVANFSGLSLTAYAEKISVFLSKMKPCALDSLQINIGLQIVS